MTDRDRIERDIDQGPWPALLALADMAEEAGDPALAAGYRWLASLKKFPAGDRGLWFWMPRRASGFRGTYTEFDAGAPGSANARLPDPVYWPVEKGAPLVIGRRPGEFDTISGAFRAAARAAGAWLAAGEGGAP
jgi:hypothetical protein